MKKEIYYHWEQYGWEDKGRVVAAMFDMTEYSPEMILLKIIEVDLPDVTEPTRELVINHKVAKLQQEKTKLQAETPVELQKIEEMISQLQSL